MRTLRSILAGTFVVIVVGGCAATHERPRQVRDAPDQKDTHPRARVAAARGGRGAPAGAPVFALRHGYGVGAADPFDAVPTWTLAADAGEGNEPAPGTETDADATQRLDVSDAMRPLPGFWQTLERDIKATPSDLWRDTKKVYGNAPNVVILGLAYGGTLAVQETGPDDTVENGLRGKDIFSDGWNETFGALGNPGTHFALAGAWYLVGQQTQDDKTYRVGKELFSALIITDLTTMIGKVATWDDSPNGEWGSFPSGHTASTFALASVMHEEYGWLAGLPLYGLGTLVGIHRLDDDEHYLSDVVFGAVLGVVVGHSVARDEPLELFGGMVLPYADPYNGGAGVAWVKSLP